MKEFKREKGLLEAQVTELSKRAAYHDDHVRLIDSWFVQVSQSATRVWCVLTAGQLLDEIRVLVNDQLQTSSASSGTSFTRATPMKRWHTEYTIRCRAIPIVTSD